MNFKGLQVYGFKSFADRLDMQFEGGFTGIVGPNGCGKSNVADAVRWVLGEQAPRQLRGSCMQDVIFNGTDMRNPLSYCEVTLVFDNTNRIFNVNFDEVAITRKLFRTGDSEYLINNVNCRLRDITDMLRDTGLGRDGLAIIGQGRVEDIVSAKPGDRRKVFEEAAGIAKLKSKKRESELRLARHRDNLDRINVILKELERQLGPLKKQAEDAQCFLDLSAQLKYQEVNYFLFKHENANKEKSDINLKIQGIKEEIDNLTAQLQAASEDYSTKMVEIGTYDEQLKELQNNLTSMLVDVEKLAGEGKVLAERLKNDNALRNSIEKAIARLREEGESKTKAVNDSQFKREQTIRNIDTLGRELDDVTDKYLTVEEDLVADQDKLESSSQSLYMSLDKLSEIKANMSKLIAERDALNEQLTEISADQDKSRAVLQHALDQKALYDKENEAIDKDIEDCNDKIDKLKIKHNEYRAKLNESNRRLIELNGRRASLEARAKMLRNMKDSYENFQSAVKNIMRDSQRDTRLAASMEGVVAELIKVPAEYEVAIETVLGGALQNIVTKTQDDAAYAIEYLKRNNYGRVTFLPMDNFRSSRLEAIFESALHEKGVIGIASDVVECDKQYRGIIDGLLGKTVIVEKIDDGIKLSRKYRNGFRIVSLEGDVFATTGSMSGGSRRSDKAEFLSRERDIEESKARLDEAIKEYVTLTELVKKMSAGLEDILDEIKVYEDKIQKKEVQKAALQEKVITAAKLYDDTVVNMNIREGKITSVKGRIDEITRQKACVEKMEEENLNERSTAGKQAEETKSLSDSKRSLRDNLAKKQSELKLEIKEQESLVKTLDADIIRLKEEITVAEYGVREQETRLEEVMCKIVESERELEKILAENSDNAEIVELKAKITNMDSLKKSLQDEMFELDFKKGELNGRINDASGKMIREEGRLIKIDSDLENMLVMIEDQYQLNYEGALDLKDPEFESNRANSEINKLKKAVNALGVVNINAIDDYKVVGERYEDLNGQRNDLVQAEEDLQQIIKELTDEMVIKFKTEFEKINMNFKTVFKELFGGGRAELILEEEEAEDPLEAGITIKAEPPGKKMQNIGLLSGGERALIAIGILFAILKSRPMPFCILDEIEAALDDSNVKVFASYLRRFSKDTQFIVITHRKPTMELADALYGVTMEEKGVSKMVSVKLSEAIKNAVSISNSESA